MRQSRELCTFLKTYIANEPCHGTLKESLQMAVLLLAGLPFPKANVHR
jgi:hypothetical protein